MADGSVSPCARSRASIDKTQGPTYVRVAIYRRDKLHNELEKYITGCKNNRAPRRAVA